MRRSHRNRRALARRRQRQREGGATENLHVVEDLAEGRTLLVRAVDRREACELVSEFNGTSLADITYNYELEKWDEMGVLFELSPVDD